VNPDGRRRAFDELDCAMAKFRELLEQLVASIGTVGKEMAPRREQVVNGRMTSPAPSRSWMSAR